MNPLRDLPSIDRVLRSHAGQRLLAEHPHARVVEALRALTQELRQQVAGGLPVPVEAAESLARAAGERLESTRQPRLRRVINATGVILHTNLGRAPLSAQAVERVLAATGYSNLELQLESGQRGSRHDLVRPLLTLLSGAESALVVNNCAAAMLLLVDEFGRGREVIVSRGELVEIGGSFRVPDVLTRGGARLVEVGTTNRTYLSDYRAAVTEHTSMLLSTHLSNFRMSGFTEAPEPSALAALARELGVLSVLDLGSGLFADLGFPEPTFPAMVQAGFDLVAFSGDKLLGASQAGIILGSAGLIARLAKNPLTRALRVDKLTLAALEGTLLDYVRDPQQIPVLSMLSEPSATVKRRAQRLARALGGLPAEVRVVASRASVGGGSAPEQELESFAVAVRPHAASLEDWARALRCRQPAVIGRRHDGALLLDARTLRDAEVREVGVAMGELV